MTAIRRCLLAIILGSAAPLYGQTPAPTAFVSWVRDHAIPLPACTAQSDASTLRSIAPIIGEARVVALGEPAHGAHEPLALRNCLFRYLVEYQGFTAIAIESGLHESRALHDHVAGGPGDARQLARRNLTWGFGRFEENVELIEWMRRYNADPAHKRKIRFYGIDVSGGDRSGEWRNARITLDDSLSYLARAAPAQSREVRAAMAPFRDRFTLSGYVGMPAADKERLRSAIGRLIRYFDRHENTLIAMSGDRDFAWARRDAILARQLETLFRVSRPAGSGGGLSPDDYLADAARDSAMADNVRWVMEQEGAAGRILLFAHNGHVMNAPGRGGIWSVYRHPPKAMGQHLRTALGHRLRIIATSAASAGPGLPKAVRPPGTIDRALGGTDIGPFIIDLRLARRGLAAEWLARDQSLRANFTTESIIIPHVAADAMTFFACLSPSSTITGEPAAQ